MPKSKTVLSLGLLVLFLSMVIPSAYRANSQSTGSQLVTAEWSRTYGGVVAGAYAIVQSADGGYAAVGTSSNNCLFIKVDSAGNLQWNQTFTTGQYAVYAKSVVQTADGGYAIVGATGYTGDNYIRIWLAKTDSNGNLQWTKNIGDNNGVSEANCLVQTSDGGYAITGDYASFTGLNGWDFLFVKTDSAGNTQWIKTIGGRDDQRAEAVVQTSDGGYALAGCTSIPGNTPLYWLVKTDSAGNMLWNQSYTESIWDWAYSMVQTSDGGYALAGLAVSGIDDKGSFWLVKTDSSGNMQWNKNIGTNSPGAYHLIQSSDGGYALAGRAEPDGSQATSGSFGAGAQYFTLAKADAAGNVQWLYGDVGASGLAVIQDQAGAFVVAGSQSLGNGIAFWVAKISSTDLKGTLPTTTPSSNPVSTSSSKPTMSPPPSASPTATPSTQQNTSTLDVSCQSSATASGFKVEIDGNLTSNGASIAYAPILLSYSVNQGISWNDLTAVSTDGGGSFSAIWMPSVTGNYLLTATYVGDAAYLSTSTTVNFAVLPYENQNAFSVTSNSTLAGLAFNSTANQLSFTVSGPPGTTGYVQVQIPKTLIADITNLQVLIDGNALNYSMQQQPDSWTISFQYHHSTHQVNIRLNPEASTTTLTTTMPSPETQPNQQTPRQWLTYAAAATAVFIIVGVVLIVKNRAKQGSQQ
jgi:hypothetical protein